jgi:hypothetical protein
MARLRQPSHTQIPGSSASPRHPIAEKRQRAEQQRNHRHHEPTDDKMTHEVNGVYPMAADTGCRHNKHHQSVHSHCRR